MCPSFTLSTMNATWTNLESKPFPSKTLASTSNHVCHGTERHGTTRQGTARHDTARHTMTRQCLKGMYQVSSGPDSSVGIATGYGLDGPGIETRGGEIFRTCPDRPWGPPSLLYNGYRVFPRGKERQGRDADPSPPSSAVVKKE